MNMLSRCLVALFLMASPVFAEEPVEEVPLFSEAELDQMLAPIALYPDQLLTQILMAATYPLEVVQAARWSREHPGLQGEDAVRAVDDKAWDPSVKSLVAFPNVLAQMDADLDWTERLGDAFLAQQRQVMDTVQALRNKAYAAGNLRSGEQVQVVREREVIYVRPARPDVIYVPYYDPLTVYGSWWWPQYRPVYWGPWPGYGMTLGYSSYGGFYWGGGINLGAGFFYSDWDWHHHYVRVVDYPPFYYRRSPYEQHIWVHDYHHRRGVPYRHVVVEHRYVPRDAQPVRRHDYGDHRDRDRDRNYYPERNDDRRDYRDRDGGNIRTRDRSEGFTGDQDRNVDRDRFERGPESRSVVPGRDRDSGPARGGNIDSRGTVAPRDGGSDRGRETTPGGSIDRGGDSRPGGSMDRGRDPGRGGSSIDRGRETGPGGAIDRGGDSRPGGGSHGAPRGSDVRGTPVTGAPARATRTQEDLARPAGSSNERIEGARRVVAPERTEAGPSTTVRRNTGMQGEPMQQQMYRSANRPEQIRAPEASEPRAQRRTMRSSTGEAPAPRDVQRYSPPVAQPREVRSISEAPAVRDRGSREQPLVAPPEGRSEPTQVRQGERSRQSGGNSGRGERGDAGRGERRERM